MNNINVEKVIDYINVLHNNELLQGMDKILRNENTYLKLEIERLNNKIQDLQADYGNKAQVERDLLKEENIRLNNIIKEADKRIYEYNNIIREVREKLIDLFGIDDKDIINILEILDTGDKYE